MSIRGMKITKLFLSILLLALSLNLQAQEPAESKPIARPGPPVTVAVAEGSTGNTKPAAGNNQIRIAELKKEILLPPRNPHPSRTWLIGVEACVSATVFLTSKAWK